MQYPDNAFLNTGSNGKTMESLNPDKPIPPDPQDRQLAPSDILGIQTLYQCQT